MNNDFDYRAFSRNDGTNQQHRMLPALDPAFAKADERTLADFLKFIYELAKEIRYFSFENVESGDWTPFFDYFLDEVSGEIQSLEEITLLLSKRSSLPPHLVLILAFLNLYKYAQQDLNGLTKKHLDYYYKDILGIKLKPAAPDKVNITFELAKHLSEYRLAGGTQLDAGKDDKGKIIQFKTDRDVVINKAKVASLKTMFLENTLIKGTQLQVAQQADSLDGRGKPFEGIPTWRPFGEAQAGKGEDGKNMLLGTIGFAISSPLLFLKEGFRTITLSMEVDSNGQTDTSLTNAFRIYLSGEKEWIEVNVGVKVNLTSTAGKQYLKIRVPLSIVNPPVTAYNEGVLKDSFTTPYPVLKLVLNQEFSKFDILKDIKVLFITLNTVVNGVRDIIIQNDEAVMDVNKPFLPFGSLPAIGSNLYIGSNEVFTKKLLSLSLHIEWHKLPVDLRSYYAGYFFGTNPVTREIFTSFIYFLYNKIWQPLITNPLFKGQDGKNGDISLDYTVFRNFNQDTTPREEILQGFNPNVKNGFIKLELTGPVFQNSDFEGFGHAVFPIVYAKKAAELSKQTPESPATVLPNQPYTPQIKLLSMDYVAEETFRPGIAGSENSFFYIEPFGSRPVTNEGNVTLLPAIDGAAHLYIGLQNFVPPQTISLLFEIEEGTSNAELPDDLTSGKDITWSYLAGTQWIDLSGADILAESTEGLQKSGIVMLAIGRNATKENTLMPTGMHWIRGKVNTVAKAEGASNVSLILSQAISATLSGDELETFELSKGLPGHTIKKLVSPVTAIRKVDQPFASFGGRSTENDKEFFTRVSERLKHKSRLSGGWDYEHLILQAFPSVFKVKCLPQLKPEGEKEYQKFEPGYRTSNPGTLSIIVVPDLRNKNFGNPLEPRCSTILLRNIEEYIKAYTSPFVIVQVQNPVYEQILLDFKVSFMPGKDAGFYAVVLNEEINRFLSPWAYEEGKDIPFGGKVYKSDLLSFVEGRDYVDFVTGFNMYHIYDGSPRGGIGSLIINKDFIVNQPVPPTIDGTKSAAINIDFIVGSPVESTTESPVIPAIIVSSPQHRITPLSSAEAVCEETENQYGIGNMIVDLDFIVLNTTT